MRTSIYSDDSVWSVFVAVCVAASVWYALQRTSIYSDDSADFCEYPKRLPLVSCTALCAMTTALTVCAMMMSDRAVQCSCPHPKISFVPFCQTSDLLASNNKIFVRRKKIGRPKIEIDTYSARRSDV